MIDNDGYRLNVGIIICNYNGQVMWAKRYKQYFWQFPQGGINFGESAKQAMYRELSEEVGLNYQDVRILAATYNWFSYKIPKKFIRLKSQPICIGQKQKWFLLQLVCPEININIKLKNIPEFDNWRWVSFWYPVRQIVYFKRDVYRKVMKEFSNIMIKKQ